MFIIICDTQQEKEHMIDTISKSDYCPFGRETTCLMDSTCKQCINERIHFVVKENFE